MSNFKKSILYIEDESTNRLLVRKILEPEGYIVFEAEDGITGIEIAARENIDLILLDINMAGMNGYEIATRIKAMDNLKNIPLIAFTANVMKHARAKALISGCDGYMTKPIERGVFLQNIKEYFDGKKDFIENDKIPELIKEYNVELVKHLEKEVRELKRVNEEMRELDKMKSDFISIASHELRTPLVTIVGYLGLALSDRLGDLTQQQYKALSVVERNAKKLERIVRDLFTLSQIEGQPSIILTEMSNPIQIVETVLEDQALILADRELEAKLIIDGVIPKIECDPDKIAQVVSNILNNSIKYTENGGSIYLTIKYPSESISRISQLDNNQYMDIIIEDTGIGIPESKLTKIFEKFVELSDIEKHHSSETEFMGGGAGLGLSICKAIIKQHKGYIWAEKREKRGTRLTVILPICQKEICPII